MIEAMPAWVRACTELALVWKKDVGAPLAESGAAAMERMYGVWVYQSKSTELYRGAEGKYYRWGERIVHFVGSAGDEGIFEVGMGKGQGGTPGARRTSGEVDNPLPLVVQVVQILADHMGERDDPNETIVECLRRIIAARYGSGAAVIVPADDGVEAATPYSDADRRAIDASIARFSHQRQAQRDAWLLVKDLFDGFEGAPLLPVTVGQVRRARKILGYPNEGE